MRRFLIFALAVSLSSPAIVWSADSRSKAFCMRLAAMAEAEGKNADMVKCLRMEEEGQEALASPDLNPDIKKYCEWAGNFIGGSYGVSGRCIQVEKKAKSELDNMQVADEILEDCKEANIFPWLSYTALKECVEKNL